MKRDFNKWFATFRECLADYTYYSDFDKVFRNVEAIRVELNILNSLIGSKNIEDDFKNLIFRYPEVLRCIPILIAVRTYEILIVEQNTTFRFNFKKPNYTIEQYERFMRCSGLFDLLENQKVSNLLDYVIGVEIGLDSNARKNRGGHIMENLVESYLVDAGFNRENNLFKEMYISDIQNKWNVDLSTISNSGKTEKRFDFVVKTSNMIYGIEANFYAGGGSKLNETARSYKTIALETTGLDYFTFVWFTDGCGWRSAKNNLEETFDVMEHIYNICDMESGIIKNIMR